MPHHPRPLLRPPAISVTRLRLLAEGRSSAEIAQATGYHAGTIKGYLTRMFLEMHVHNRVALLMRCHALGVIDLANLAEYWTDDAVAARPVLRDR
jgi:DNA-binding CsgD family transcriptional regulator